MISSGDRSSGPTRETKGLPTERNGAREARLIATSLKFKVLNVVSTLQFLLLVVILSGTVPVYYPGRLLTDQ